MAQRFSGRRMMHIVWAIGWSDFFLKYRGSVLGYLWSLLAPLTKFVVILYVFQPLVGSTIVQYPLYLFLGLLIWEHFAATTNGCITMLWDKAAIIQTIPCPRILLILAVGLTNGIVFMTHMVVFVFFALLMGNVHAGGYLLLPVLLLQMTLLTLGIGMLLSSFALKYRDVQHLWHIALQVLFWLTPITYGYALRDPVLSEAGQLLARGVAFTDWTVLHIFVLLQPLSVLTYDARRFFLYLSEQGMPSAFHVAGLTFACAAAFLVGALVFRKRSRFFLEEY